MILSFRYQLENFVIDWDRIISNDQLSCARSLICQITAGAERDNQEAKLIEALVQYVPFPVCLSYKAKSAFDIFF